MLTAYYDALRVYQIKDTRGIMIDFRSGDSKLAADIANKLAELYRDDLSQRSVLESQDAGAKLAPQIKKLAEEVAEAETEVTRFRGQSNIFDGGRDKTGLNEQQLSELNAELTRMATGRAETEARAREAREIAARGAGETLPDVQKSQLVPRLVEQRVRVERQIAELSATLLPAHPRMKQLNADLAGLNRQIRGEVDKIVDGLEREAKVSAMREDGVRRRLDEAKRRVVSAGGDDVKLRALESLAKSKRAEFERLQTQLESARTTSDARTVPVEVQIVSRARPSSEKAWPKVGMITLLAMAATVLLGLAFAVTRELFGMARPAPAAASFHRRRPSSPCRPPWRAATTARTMPSVARHLIAKAQGRTGFRTLVAGEAAGASAGTVGNRAGAAAGAPEAAGHPARLEPRWRRPGAGARRVAHARHHRRALGPRLLRGRDRAPVGLAGARHPRRLERRRHHRRQGQGPREHAAGRARRCLRSCGHRWRARGGA